MGNESALLSNIRTFYLLETYADENNVDISWILIISVAMEKKKGQCLFSNSYKYS